MPHKIVNDPMSTSSYLGRRSSVLAIITHYRCEDWLADCLESIVTQTRLPQGIVVVDDGSEHPPLDIVRRFPQVTLFAANQNVGHYRLLQRIVSDAAYDAFMFQDADDWSSPGRLAVLLEEAERTGAEMAGCQVCDECLGPFEVSPVDYPADVNASLLANPYFQPILFATSVASRHLVSRVGGFASALRFGGDSEFIRRAIFLAKIVNAPHRFYHRRIRPNSLTRHPDTGLTSPARQELRAQLIRRTEDNIASCRLGRQPDLRPLAVAGPVALRHLSGPQIRTDGRGWQLG